MIAQLLRLMGNQLGTIASPIFREMQIKSLVDVARLVDLQKHSYGFGLDYDETRAFLSQSGFSATFIEAMFDAFTDVGTQRPEAVFSTCDFLGALIVLAGSPREDTDFSEDAITSMAAGVLARHDDVGSPNCCPPLMMPKLHDDVDKAPLLSAFDAQAHSLRSFARRNTHSCVLCSASLAGSIPT